MECSINGGAKIAVQLSDTSGTANIAASITAALSNNATLAAAGITATAADATHITIASSNSTNFRVNLASQTAGTVDLQLGGATNLVGTQTASVGSASALPAQSSRTDASGSAQTGLGADKHVFSFQGLVNPRDQPTLSFPATHSTHSLQ